MTSDGDSTSTTANPSGAKRQRLIKWAQRLLIVLLVGLLATMLFTRFVTGDSEPNAVVQDIAASVESIAQQELVVISVNCAHGRGAGTHQALTSNVVLRSNCTGIGELLAKNNADLACLQECDAPSWWSGRFDHAKLIGETAGLPHLVHALNVDGAGLHYGTAVLSKLEVQQAETVTFRPTPPTFSKGFAVAQVAWPGDPNFKFDVVSVHLDFASGSARAKQVDQLVEIMQARTNPLIVVGDLNSDWSEGGAPRRLANSLGLTAFEPEARMPTFPSRGTRLDWVLVSSDFELASVEPIDVTLSDHLPLRAVIRRIEK